MKTQSGETTSIWTADAAFPSATPLQANANTDVCIVGAGISGLTTAYLLACEGKSVVVLNDGPIASGESARTTAHLVDVLDRRYFELARLHGEDGARLAAESHRAAIDTIERIVRERGIDCDFERLDGYLVVPPGGSPDLLRDELLAAQRAGLYDVEQVGKVPYHEYDFGPALRFPNQAQFHALKYLSGLVQATRARGGRIHASTHVEAIDDGQPARVVTADGFTVTAGDIVVATNTPINNRVRVHTKQAAYRTYVVGARVPAGSVPRLLLWDTLDPYHYVRVAKESAGQDVLVIGGEDHKTGQDDDSEARYERLELWMRERFPMVRDIAFHWSGQVMEPNDGLAFIGRNPGDERVYIVTGESGNGMTYGTIAGILLTDLIRGRANPWAKLYDPARVKLRAAGEFVKENLNAAAQYVDLVTGGDVDEARDIPLGSGAIIRRGIKKIAVYRDEQGGVHELSAICPHLGCVVGWNDGEKTWDCPCHGSRFAKEGHVINGPAIRDLAPIEPEERA